MRIELSSLNAMESDNTHVAKFIPQGSEHYALTTLLTHIKFPFNPEVKPNSMTLMAYIQCEDSIPIAILDSTFTQKLYDEAIKSGFTQDKSKQSEDGYHIELCLVAPFLSRGSLVGETEEKIHKSGVNVHKSGVNVHQSYVNINPKAEQ